MINISLLFGVFLLVVCSTLGSGGYKWANRRCSAPDYRLPPPISRFDRYVTMVLKGRQMHAEKLLTEDEFNCLGRCSGARPEQCTEFKF